MKTKRLKLTTFLVAATFVFITSQAIGQPNCCNPKWSVNADTQWWNYNTPAEYALTAEQISEINKLRKESNEKTLTIENELRTLRMEYRAANSESNLDVEKVKSLRSNIRDKEEKIEDINLKTKVQIKKLLNEKQLAYFNNNQYNWWDMGENCWYNGKMGMSHGKQAMRSGRSRCW